MPMQTPKLVITGRDGILNIFRTDHVKAPEEWQPEFSKNAPIDEHTRNNALAAYGGWLIGKHLGIETAKERVLERARARRCRDHGLVPAEERRQPETHLCDSGEHKPPDNADD